MVAPVKEILLQEIPIINQSEMNWNIKINLEDRNG